MKVLIVAPRVWNGGVEVHVSAFALLLRANGHETTLVVDERYPEDPAKRTEIISSGCRIVAFPDLDSRGILFRLATQFKVLRKNLEPGSFDVVFCEGYGQSLPFYSRYVKRPGGKLIFHEHMDGVISRNKLVPSFHYPNQKPYNPFFRTLLKKADGIIAGCERAAENFKQFYAIDKVALLAPSLLPHYNPKPAAERHLLNGRIRIGVFGFLKQQKGTGPLLRLWPQLNIGDAELHLYGADCEGYQVEAQKAGLR